MYFIIDSPFFNEHAKIPMISGSAFAIRQRKITLPYFEINLNAIIIPEANPATTIIELIDSYRKTVNLSGLGFDTSALFNGIEQR